jgi:hypothetical protein
MVCTGPPGTHTQQGHQDAPAVLLHSEIDLVRYSATD